MKNKTCANCQYQFRSIQSCSGCGIDYAKWTPKIKIDYRKKQMKTLTKMNEAEKYFEQKYPHLTGMPKDEWGTFRADEMIMFAEAFSTHQNKELIEALEITNRNVDAVISQFPNGNAPLERIINDNKILLQTLKTK